MNRPLVPRDIPFHLRPTSFVLDLQRVRLAWLIEQGQSRRKARNLDKAPKSRTSNGTGKRKKTVEELTMEKLQRFMTKGPV